MVGTLATVFSITSLIDTDELALVSGGSEVAAVMGLTALVIIAGVIAGLCVHANKRLKSEYALGVRI